MENVPASIRIMSSHKMDIVWHVKLKDASHAKSMIPMFVRSAELRWKYQMESVSVPTQSTKLTLMETVNFVQYKAANLARPVHQMNVLNVRIAQLG